MLQNHGISFRKLEEKDLKMMHKWLNTDFVIEWFEKGGSTFEKISEKYLPRIKGEQPTFSFVILYKDIDIGYIQTYMINDYPDYSKYLNVDDDAAGMDMFIGEKAFIHKGLGKIILSKFLNEYVFELNKASCCVIGPEPNNKVAIRAYEKAGFKYLKTIQVTDEDEPEYLMRLNKNELVNLE